MINDEIIKSVHELINNGKIVWVINKKNKDDAVLWLSNDKKYISCRHLGQFAVKNTTSELKFLFDKLLETDDIDYRVSSSVYL